jgi:hypothetical protein
MTYIHRKKRIYLNRKRTKYCTVKLYKDKKEMQAAMKSECGQRGSYKDIWGLHHAYDRILVPKKGRSKLLPETGTVYLCIRHCGAGVVSHELLHAVLWAWKHKRGKKQYPIVIKDMKEEEEVLHNHTDAVRDFYTWYWKIEKSLR